MAKYRIKHHQVIESALKNFNADFFCANNIVFGGGTRIALELNEFRESIDIDFLCPNRDSYRAVREQITNISLGELVNVEFPLEKETVANMYGVRTVIKHEKTLIKLEFVSCDNYELVSKVDLNLFPVPFLDRASCFYTKLLANADRGMAPPYKDLFDIVAMYKEWGSIPMQSIKMAESHTGEKIVIPSLIEAIKTMLKNPDIYKKTAKNLKMNTDWINEIVIVQAKKLLIELEENK